jgi:lysophospholipase L1-like esterase
MLVATVARTALRFTAAEPAPAPSASATATPARPAPGRTVRVMPLGDSITLGIGSTTTSSYRADLYTRLVAAGLRVDFVGSLRDGQGAPDLDHEGHSGWTIDQIAGRVDDWLATYRPDVILLHIGTNDMRNDVRARGAPDRLAALIARLRADRPDAEIFVARLAGAKLDVSQRRIDAFNAALAGIVAAGGARVHLVDQSTVDGLDIRDNLHPNDYGYAKMSFNWYQAIGQVFGAAGTAWPTADNPYLAREAYRCLLEPTYPHGVYQGVVECAWYRRDKVVGTARDSNGAVYR